MTTDIGMRECKVQRRIDIFDGFALLKNITRRALADLHYFSFQCFAVPSINMRRGSGFTVLTQQVNETCVVWDELAYFSGKERKGPVEIQ